MDAKLLAEVRARPDAIEPRLVLADALQAEGDPQGELIAVQCELARLGAPAERVFQDWINDACVEADITALRKREKQLLKQHGAAWMKSAQRFAVEDGVSMRCGFVERVRWDCTRHFAKGLAPLIEAAPLLRALEFATDRGRGSLTTLCACQATR